VCEAVLPYLDDSDEAVRFGAAETLLKHGDVICRKPLAQILADGDESMQQRSLILSGFIGNGWWEEAADNLSNMPSAALKAAAEALERAAPIRIAAKDASEETPQEQETRLKVRNLLLSVAEADAVSDEVQNLVCEYLVRSGVTVQGARGRVEKILPKGYKIRKQHVERLPEGMREPFLTLSATYLMERAGRDEAAEGLVKIFRCAHTAQETKGRIVEHWAASRWNLQTYEKLVTKHLPPGYRISTDGLIVRSYDAMGEPYLTQAADNLLDPFLSEPPDDSDEARTCVSDEIREALLEIVCNTATDERTIDRIMDRFAAYGWSVRDHEKRLARSLPDEYRISAPRGTQHPRITKVSTRI